MESDIGGGPPTKGSLLIFNDPLCLTDTLHGGTLTVASLNAYKARGTGVQSLPQL